MTREERNRFIHEADLIHIRQSVAGNTFPRLAANVRLIAAAPDLLNAVRDAADYFHDFIESDQQETELAAAFRAVIKKAVGGAA